MTRQITALHTLQNGETATALGNLPGPDDWLTASEMLGMARQIHQHAIDAQRITETPTPTPTRHPATPGYLEYPDPPTFDESASFDPVGIDSEELTHD